ncbi:hypothetical protein OJF2_66710 [Aquisphaera giovannonii]|uniref:Uncharacterized protein n=1 Tax=Aquisphaera giovannonii TaxID=406548 RepID=A0A5B9WC63_9BACT|nr:hypothetical protein OJF2_66710 [Aquisphaera giovannonii]
MDVYARTVPASGPEGNSAVRVAAPGGWVEGTRTEAAQKVPQAKPEWAEPIASPPAVARVVVAPMASWAPGEAGVPR